MKKKPTIINFNKKILDQLPFPQKGKRAYYHDALVKNLILDITPTGNKSFYYYKKINKTPQRIFIGKYEEISIITARQLARELAKKITKERLIQK